MAVAARYRGARQHNSWRCYHGRWIICVRRMHRRIEPSWQSRPIATPGIPPGVDVWRIALQPAADLSMRAQAHAARQTVLANYLGVPPQALRLDHAEGGKPFIAQPAGALEFNLSHCADLALLAVSASHAVGIDVEGERRIPDPLRLARRVLDDDSIARLSTLPEHARTALFLDLWTQLDARQKALGHGIFASPVSAEPMCGLSFHPSAGHIACLAIASPVDDVDIRFFDYHDAAPTPQ